MSFVYEKPIRPANLTFGGGEAPFSELWASSRELAMYADNFNADEKALEEAYDRRIDAIHSAIGVSVKNPMRQPTAAPRAAGVRGGQIKTREQWMADFDRHISLLIQQHPAARDAISPGMPVTEEAKQLARDAETRFGRAVSSRQDFFGKWSAVIGGGMAGGLRDPVQVATLAAGGGPGAVRTVAGRILTVALKEMVINGAVEAALQPKVQAWREKAGLEAGFVEAARNTVFAAAAGGLFGLGGQMVAEAGRAVFKGRLLDSASALAAEGLDPASPLARSLKGAPTDSPSDLAAIREVLPPEARGALDARAADAGSSFASFRTAKGSTYEFHSDGTTTRVKAARSDPGHEGDFGPKPRSERTYFLSPDQAARLGAPADVEWRVIDHGNGSISLATRNSNGGWGIAPSQRNVPVLSGPELGAIPLELWGADEVAGSRAFKRSHYGNAITEISNNAPNEARQAEALRFAEDPQEGRLGDLRRELTREMGARPGGRQAVSLLTFLAREGGLAEASDLAAMDAGRWFGPGGRLVRKEGGLSLDEARRRAVEAGYLQDTAFDGGNSVSTIDDLTDAIAAELAGQKVYSRLDGDADALAHLQRQHDDAVAHIDTVIGKLEGVMTDDLPPALKRRAADILLGDETADAEIALERAIMEDYYAGEPERALSYDDGSEIPFETDDGPGSARQRDDAARPGIGPDRAGEGSLDPNGGQSGSFGEAQGRPAEPAGGVDDPLSAEEAALTDEMLKELDPDGELSESFDQTRAIKAEADELGELAMFLTHCKAGA